MMRGINRQAIFDDDEDCRRFMDILADLPFQHDDEGRLLPIRTCVVYAWCLMTNHFHLLVMEKDWKIADVIKSLASSYVYYYNKKNERIGHLFIPFLFYVVTKWEIIVFRCFPHFFSLIPLFFPQ